MDFKRFLLIFLFPLIIFANNFDISQLKKYNFSYTIFDLKKTKYIEKYNINQKFPPASLIKIFSSYYLLKYFPDSLLKDNIYGLDGIIVNDTTLYGNIIIKLTGNPLTGSEYSNIRNPIKEFFQIIKQKKKICKIKQNIIIDYSALPYFKKNSFIYDYQTKWFYSAPACGINYNFNYFSVIIKNYKNIPYISIYPPIANIKLYQNIHYLENIKSKINIKVSNILDTIKIKGQINKKIKTYNIKLSATNPKIFIKKIIKYYLSYYKINLKGKIILSEKIYHPIDLDTILLEKVPNIKNILKIANFESSNFIFEQLFLILQKRNNNINLLHNLMRNILTDKNFNIVDYSGLSEKNYLSIKQFIDFIKFIYAQDHNTWKKLLNVLPKDKDIQFFNDSSYNEIIIKTGLLENSFSLFLYSNQSKKIYLFFFDKLQEKDIEKVIWILKKQLLNINKL